MKNVSTILTMLVGLFIFAAPAPAHAQDVGIGICIGGNSGSSVHVILGEGRDPGMGYGWGTPYPYGLNGSPKSNAAYGLVPPRPYPQPIPEDHVINVPSPIYEWVKDPQTGDLSLKRTGWTKEPVNIKTYRHP